MALLVLHKSCPPPECPCIVDDSRNGLAHAVRGQDKIARVHVGPEEVTVFATVAEAHSTGELAVCAGSCGPVNLHVINAPFSLARGGSGDCRALRLHRDRSGYFQEKRPQDLFRECSHYCGLNLAADQVPRPGDGYPRSAVGKRGVSVATVSGEVALQPAVDAPPPQRPARLWRRRARRVRTPHRNDTAWSNRK
jgi:pyruvate dehydrogenase (quinone)